MAENVEITAGTGTTVAADDVAGVKYQQVKLVDGAADSTTVINAGGGVEAGALRVTIASDSTGVISIDDNGSAITVDGTVDLGVTDSAYLSAIKTAIEILDNIVAGTEAQVDVVTVPAPLNVVGGGVELGALRVTIANDSTGVITVDDGGSTISVDGTVTANLSATDNGVLDAIQTAVETLDNAIAGNEMQVDVITLPTLPAGTSLIGKVGIDQVTANANEVVVKSGTVTADVTGSGDVPVTLDGETVQLAASTNNIGDVDVASITAGENHIGEVGLPDDTITITCSCSTDAYADGDVLFDTQEIASAVRNNGDTCILQSVHVLDKADQGIDFELLFLNAATSIGTENAAIDISAANAAAVIGHFAFTNDYVDLINSQVRSEGGIGLMLEAGAATTSLYVAGISKGAGTYGASDILITFGFLRN